MLCLSGFGQHGLMEVELNLVNERHMVNGLRSCYPFNRLSICSTSKFPLLGEWTRIEVGQRVKDGEYTSFYISINGKEVHSERNSQPSELNDVKAYASAPRAPNPARVHQEPDPRVQAGG